MLDRELLEYYTRTDATERTRLRDGRAVAKAAVADADRATEVVWTEDRIQAAGTDAWLFEAVRSLLQISAGEALFLQGTLPLCARRPAVTRLVFPLALLAAVKALRRAAVRARWSTGERARAIDTFASIPSLRFGRAGRHGRRASACRPRAAVLQRARAR